MPSVFALSKPLDVDELATFLKRILSPTVAMPGFDADHLAWKYWMPRSDWEGSRSYVLKGERGIEAHCGVVPGSLHSNHGGLKVAHFIDWAADPRAFTAGARLLKKVATIAGTLCAVGGSQATRKILPLMGFRPADQVVALARPVRSIRQAATHQVRNWKLPVRLLRNAIWATIPRIRIPAGWSFESVFPNQVPDEIWSPPATQWAVRQRSPALYAYYLACPIVRFELFLIRRGAQPAGCCLIGFVHGQARVADLWLIEESPENYAAGYKLALMAALTDPTVAEVVVHVSIPPRIDALMRCGFREYWREPVMVLPADSTPPDGFDCQLLDNDEAYLTTGATAYLT